MQAGLSVLIGDDQEKLNDCKKIYYSNLINYIDDERRDLCRVTNQFYEFLQNDYSQSIEIKISNNSDVSYRIAEQQRNLGLSNYEKLKILDLYHFKNTKFCKTYTKYKELQTQKIDKRMKSFLKKKPG